MEDHPVRREKKNTKQSAIYSLSMNDSRYKKF